VAGFLATYPATDAGVSCIDRRRWRAERVFLLACSAINSITAASGGCLVVYHSVFSPKLREHKEEFAVGIDSQPAGDTLLSLEFLPIYFRFTMITQGNYVPLPTHHNNTQRYRELLETSLTVFERQYIERQLSEEQLAIETLAAEILGLDGSILPANTPLSGFPRQA